MEYQFDCLAITGGIGSGKSTVLDLLKTYGFNIINVDELGHTLLQSSSPYYKDYAAEIDHWLGSDYVSKDCIDRNSFREIIKNLPNGFVTIGQIATPYLLKSMQNEYQKYKPESVIFEVPMLLESGLHKYFKSIAAITCDTDIRIKRVLARDPHFTQSDILQRILLQTSDADKLKIANYQIDNSKDLEHLQKEVLLFVNNYKRLINEKKSFTIK